MNYRTPNPGEQAKSFRDLSLAQAVLPVRFHQADACMATLTEFETMCELNP